MKYIGYDLVISEEKLVLDKEITLKKIEWSNGDYFEVKEQNGQVEMVRVDPLLKFLKEGCK
jgi:hypothetical protein